MRICVLDRMLDQWISSTCNMPRGVLIYQDMDRTCCCCQFNGFNYGQYFTPATWHWLIASEPSVLRRTKPRLTRYWGLQCPMKILLHGVYRWSVPGPGYRCGGSGITRSSERWFTKLIVHLRWGFSIRSRELTWCSLVSQPRRSHRSKRYRPQGSSRRDWKFMNTFCKQYSIPNHDSKWTTDRILVKLLMTGSIAWCRCKHPCRLVPSNPV